jgi:hypothetical protein
MNSLKFAAKRMLPAVAWKTMSRGYYAYAVRRKTIQIYLDPRMLASIWRIRQYKNKHWGQRCFIIGNGPSLKQTDLSLLRNEVTFGLNRIYLLFDQLGFTTTYYVAVNRLVIEQCAPEIEQLSIPSFMSWHSRDVINFTRNMMFIRRNREQHFFRDIVYGIKEGSTVTYAAMQIAYYMGFHQVILIGVDHSFVTQGKPHTTIVSEGDDPNHFHPGYFGKGFRWQLPDLEGSEAAYRVAKQVFEQSGRSIIDATIDGKLDVFPKVEYRTLFG